MRAIIIIIFTVMMAGTCKAQTFDFSCGDSIQIPVNTDGVYTIPAGETHCGTTFLLVKITVVNAEITSIKHYPGGEDTPGFDHVGIPFTLLLVKDNELTLGWVNGDETCTFKATKQ